MIKFFETNPGCADILSLFLSEDDPKGAVDQIHESYPHGGGWNDFKGFDLYNNCDLVYPGDPPMKPVAVGVLRKEVILLYPYPWVVVVQPDRSFRVAYILT